MRKRNTFRPTDIGGCTLWLDGADPAGTGVAPVAGSTITTWADKSTSANNATAYGTVTVNTLVNGKLAILTTASSGFFGYLTNSTTTATTFVVATYVNANAYNRLFAVSSGTLTEYNNPGVALFACAINGASMGPFYNSQNVTPVTSGPITQNQPFIMTTLFTGTQCRVNLNGISTTTSPVNISTSFSYTYYGIGTHANGFGSVGECWNGIIAEVIHYQAALSLQNYQQVEGYLSQKWGLRQQIPQSHPGTTGIVYSQQSIPKALSLPYSSAFTPSVAGTVSMWLDGMDPAGTGIPPSNGATVSTWVDKSGSGINLTAVGTPTYTSANSSVYLDGSSYLQNTNFNFTNYTLFIVSNQASYIGPLYTNNTTTAGYSGFFPIYYGSYYLVQSDSSWLSAGSPFLKDITYLYSIQYDSLNNINVWSTGSISPVITGTAGTITRNKFLLGKRNVSIFSENMTGNIFEIIQYNSDLGQTARQQVEGYLAWKWGLQANLPANHPYKSSTPDIKNARGISRPVGLPVRSNISFPRLKFIASIDTPSATLSSLTSTGATVTWSEISGAISYTVTIYYNSSASVTTSNLQVAQSPYIVATSGSTFTFTATDTTYYAATVTAISASAQATSSISSAVLYTAAPGQVSANTPTNTGTTLNMAWSAASGSVTAYTVYVLAGGSLAPSGTLSLGNVTSTTFSPMVSGTAYSFYVVATGPGGSGTQSTTTSEVTYTAAPGQASVNTPTNTGTTLNMTWSAASGSVTAYTVYVLAGGSLAPSGTLSLGNVTSTTFSPMVSGTAYSFYVVATGPGGSGTQSTTTSEVTYTAAPGQASVNTPTNTGTTLNMTWSAPGSGEAVTGYTVYVLAGNSLAPSGTLTPGLVTSTTFSPMVSGTAYSFYVVATGVGGSGTQSTTSATVTYTAAPVAPTTVTLASLTETDAIVTWSGGSGATSYTCQIYSSASSNMSSPSIVSQTPSSSTAVTSPQAFTFTATASLYYGAIITAVNSGGSTASAMSTGVLYDTSALAAPTTVTIVSVTLSGVTVTWSGDTGATSYTCQIYYSTSSDMSSPTTISQSPSASTSVSPWQLFTISVQDSFYYGAIVTAVNASGSLASSMSSGLQFNNVYTGTSPVTTYATGFGNLYGLAMDSAENIYLADFTGHKIWYIPLGGSPSVFAGSTTGIVNGDVSTAKFSSPTGVAVNAAGTIVYVCDSGNGKIRKITGGTVTTLAGAANGAWLDGASGVARFSSPGGIALDRTETVLFVGDKLTHRIRVVTIATGAVTTLAGGNGSAVAGTGAFVNGTGSSAAFNQPLGLCVGLDNSVYVADSVNQRIRKVTYPGGVVTTIAGDGTNAFLNGTGTGARFRFPYGVGIDSYGILYVADKDSYRIRRITGTGVVTTFAGAGSSTSIDNADALLATFTQLTGVVVNPSGNALYATHFSSAAVRKITLYSYTVAPVAPTTVALPSLIATGATVTWSGGSGAISYRVQIYSSASSDMSSPSTVSHIPISSVSVTSSQAFTFTAVDTLYYGAIVTAVNAAGSTASSMSTGLLYRTPVAPTSVILSPLVGTGASISWSGDSGATSYTCQIYSSASSDMSSPSTVVQSPISSASVTSPLLFTYTATNGLYYGAIVTTVNFAGSSASLISTGVLYTGSPSALAPTTVTITSLTFTGATVTWSGDSGAASYTCQIYYSAASNMSSPGILPQSPSASTSVSSGQLFSIFGQDNYYYAAIITAVSAGGSASSISSGVLFSGSYMGTPSVSTIVVDASILRPYAVAVDSAQNIYVVDNFGHKIWYIPSGGSLTVFAFTGVSGYQDGDVGTAKISSPGGIAVNTAGTIVYVSDNTARIRKITGGIVSTLAGTGVGGYLDGASNVAQFSVPQGLLLNKEETLLFVADKYTHRIRIITLATGAVTTLAGGLNSTVGATTGSYADGTGTNASFNSLQDLCFDIDNNNIFVADTGNNRIRKVTYPGGVVTTIAGDGISGSTDATGTGARFASPSGIIMDSYGILYVGDANRKIRKITGAGVVTLFAGTGTASSTDNANALLATMYVIAALDMGSSRSIYAVQYSSLYTQWNGVRKITMA